MQAIVGKLLRGHFKVISPLGGGGGGDTFTAIDIDRPGNPKCVVKRFKPPQDAPHLLSNARNLFRREAETLERLGQMHEQIPRLLAHFEEDEEFYLVQDFIEGHPLSVELPSGHRWSETKVIQLLKDVLMTLEFVHSQNVIHRDVKPTNLIRRSKDNKLVLIDFGAVKQVRGDQTITQTRIVSPTTISIGTEGYMPPEQWMGKPHLSSDIYALGMIGIQALTGTDQAQLTQLPRDANLELIWQSRAEVGKELAAVLSKMVSYHFIARYQSASEALQALQACFDRSRITAALNQQDVKSEPDDAIHLRSTLVIQSSESSLPIDAQEAKLFETNVSSTYENLSQLSVEQVAPDAKDSRLLPETTKVVLETQRTSQGKVVEPRHSEIELSPEQELSETKFNPDPESLLLTSITEVQLAETKIAHTLESQSDAIVAETDTETELKSAKVIANLQALQSEETVKVDLSETKFSQPERAQTPFETPKTISDQPETANSSLRILEAKQNCPEHTPLVSEIPETKYSQLKQSSLEVPETKYSPPGYSHATSNISQLNYSSTPRSSRTSSKSVLPLSQGTQKVLLAGLGVAALGVVGIIINQSFWYRTHTPLAPQSPRPEEPRAESFSEWEEKYPHLKQLKLYLTEQPPNWEAADRETYQVMLKLAGTKSESQGFFDLNEWNRNLSCEDFQAIDQLWSDASNKQLGFSAQNSILNKVGDQTKYLHEIGWQRGQERLVSLRQQKDTNRFTYNLGKIPNFTNPPPGHLPAMLIWSDKTDHRFRMVNKCVD